MPPSFGRTWVVHELDVVIVSCGIRTGINRGLGTPVVVQPALGLGTESDRSSSERYVVDAEVLDVAGLDNALGPPPWGLRFRSTINILGNQNIRRRDRR